MMKNILSQNIEVSHMLIIFNCVTLFRYTSRLVKIYVLTTLIIWTTRKAFLLLSELA